MSGFILNRGASFAAKYREYVSQPVKSENVKIETVPEITKVKETPAVETTEQISLEESDTESLVSLDDSIVSLEELESEKAEELDITEVEIEDDEEELTQKFNELRNIKLKFEGKIHKFLVEYANPFWKNLDNFYKTLGVSKKSHELVLTYNDKVLSLKDSPQKLSLTIVDIVECYAKERYERESDESRPKKSKEPKDPNVLEIKFRNNEDGKHAIPVALKIHKSASMEKIMEEYAKIKGYTLSDLIFDFDGDRLAGEETPIDLEMENGSLVDVIVKKRINND